MKSYAKFHSIKWDDLLKFAIFSITKCSWPMFNNGKFDTNFISFNFFFGMEQSTLRNISNCLNTNINSNLETSGGQSSNT
jgi:hypothetical protein